MKSMTPGQDIAPEMAPAKQQGIARGWILLAGVVFAAAVLLVAFPEQRAPSLAAFWDYFIELISVIPAIFVIIGLFTAWVPKETITRYLGHGAGVRGLALALILGALPTGPLYAAFPLSKGLLDKGASKANIFIFLAAWACIKVPQELVELQFLGWRFMLARLVVTVAVVVIIAFVFEWVLDDRRHDATKHL